MKVDAKNYGTHNPYEESHWVSRLRENFTSGSYGEGLETDLRAPRQSLTRQTFFGWWKRHLHVYHLFARSKNGLMVQILSGLITYLLLALYCQGEHGEPVSIVRVRQLRNRIRNEALLLMAESQARPRLRVVKKLLKRMGKPHASF